ncbi:hypothetical protein [Actinoplanes couchii]|uniref:Uncharacterized protein n=1 Tax=Actinoplanes couchii TaxID=403638 RepID=A0ABQ3WZL1_9ACTN|nr:hypothetical protein [Actinoplanes couchii]MDR6316097.1 hypothetical protein [Actinoplanes couchii]GID51712.1 hypothetical protein Aco03nite_001160 [Actinoplanes couchii]
MPNLSRRAMFSATAATTTAALYPTSPATAAPDTAPAGAPPPRESFKVTDRRGRQRFLLDSRKPPIIIDGREIPAAQRGGPENASWMIFNDDNGNEIGGILAATTGGSITFDYPGAVDAIKVSSTWRDGVGGAGLNVNAHPTAMPTSGAPKERVLLGWRSDLGAMLHLTDSQGRPRISLQVDVNDNPSIHILDATGQVVSRFPPA